MSVMTETVSLTDLQWAKLTGFGLKPAAEQDQQYALDSVLLLDDEQCLATLNAIMPELGAPELKVTASLVIKRSAFLLLAPTLYAMSVFDKGLDASIDNCVFEYQLHNRLWRSGMPLKQTQAVPCQHDRSAWRELILSGAFAGHLTPLIEQLQRLSGVSPRILWENVAVRVFSIYERRILPALDSERRRQAEGDLAYLLDESTRSVFDLDENPLTRFYRTKRHWQAHSEPVRMRRTCCYYYQATEPPEFCSNCPLLLKRK
ncbi:IucA/IucC family C-terminal-domain containing protein [Vibrio ostreae]|uniref:(2Fe-2S)-binding protein n=1 Tax=Vibrio ostreae TaxID=2841925 RepID=A0A975YML6_9VIBR|nr:IucA/IucC family C-terminal-domain containing protein [Vibrio ostreae]QXO16560.1 (2Fe-2S)-binding protein [Vibrio ostreae]